MTFKEFIDASVRLSDEHTEAAERLKKKLEELLADIEEQNRPAEPLIKDEKIRKAVRAWADSNGVKEVAFFKEDFGLRLMYHSISIDLYGDADELEDFKKYTITELCGEEEE